MSTLIIPTQETEVPAEREHLHHLLRQMLLIRRFEDKCAEVYTATKIRGFMHLYNGEEAIAVGVMQALRPEDSIVATYRDHGHALARGVDPGRLMAEMYAKVEGCCRGRGGSMHIFDKETRFFGGNAIVCGHLPLALGLALADRKLGRPHVTACFFGEGACAEGEFHESLNLAALWKLPILFICENNQYCMGSAIRYTQSDTEIYKKPIVYGIQSARVDGMDVLAVEAAAREAVEAVRNGPEPRFLEFLTYRFRAHSMFDAELYRTKSEVEEWKQRDPIILLNNHLRSKGMLSDEDLAEMEKGAAAEVDRAVAFAEAGTWESVEDLTRFVYSETSSVLKRSSS
jgi:pyruvate dehydrogenase E1 component alpha subunit